MHFDTIAAISTPAGEGAIGIVRVSGDDAVEIVNSIFKGKDLLTVPSHTIHYGNIVDPVTNESIEEVLVAVLRAPKTFTREDVVEINCHGGIMTVNKVLQTVLIKGARLAEPGEFTKRAFLNGRIDLSQAEAVMDLIRSKTDKAMKSALSQVEGRLSKLIKKLRQELIEILAHIEVNIDYPEYDDVEEMTHSMLLPKAYFVKTEIEKLLETSKQGKILREGLSTAIIGRPNVGKSSLLNALVQENKAIVTEIAGTTRDVIEEYVNVRGVPLKLLDTAGIRETEDIVEQIGVEKSRKVISEADFVLLILNNSEVLTEQDRELIKLTENKQRVILINKTDLPKKIDLTEVEGLINGDTMITGSILQDEGIEKLEQCIADLFFSGNLEGQDTTYISNTRHINILQLSHRAISDAINSIESGIPIDLAQIDLTKSWELLGEITGESVHESLLDQLFSQFCLGK